MKTAIKLLTVLLLAFTAVPAVPVHAVYAQSQTDQMLKLPSGREIHSDTSFQYHGSYYALTAKPLQITDPMQAFSISKVVGNNVQIDDHADVRLPIGTVHYNALFRKQVPSESGGAGNSYYQYWLTAVVKTPDNNYVAYSILTQTSDMVQLDRSMKNKLLALANYWSLPNVSK